MQADELVMQPKKKRGRPRKVLGVRGAMADRTRLQRASLHERATEKLRSLIVRGDLAPESVLVESELCDLLGVSRTPLREALKLLACRAWSSCARTAARAYPRSARRRSAICSRR